MSRALLLLLVWVRLAGAQQNDPRQHFDAGNDYYSAGEFEAALREFQAGYALLPNPKFLLNMGQTYRKLGRLDDARAALLKYMDTLGAGDQRRGSVADVVAEIDLERRRHDPAPDRPPSPPGNRRARLAGISLLAVGGAAMVSGAALLGIALRDDQFLASPPADWRFDPAVARERDATFPAGVSLLTVSALAVIGGGIALRYAR
jgi:tetratricopeptide (TPR) repeat protein